MYMYTYMYKLCIRICIWFPFDLKTQITTADNHINQDKTDKMKNLKCYLTHTCSASKPLPVTIVACVVHLPPLPPRRLARRVKSSRITSSAGRRLAGGQRGGGGWAKSARIHSWQAGAGPGEGEPAQLCSHSTWQGERGGRGILAGRNAAMQNTNHRDGKHCRGCNLFESAWLVWEQLGDGWVFTFSWEISREYQSCQNILTP